MRDQGGIIALFGAKQDQQSGSNGTHRFAFHETLLRNTLQNDFHPVLPNLLPQFRA
jgi:hypothetical protein